MNRADPLHQDSEKQGVAADIVFHFEYWQKRLEAECYWPDAEGTLIDPNEIKGRARGALTGEIERRTAGQTFKSGGLGRNLLDVNHGDIATSVSASAPLLTIGLPCETFSPYHTNRAKEGELTRWQGLSSQQPIPLFWFPNGLPAGESLFVGSSRLGQRLDQFDTWFDGLRTLASRLIPGKVFFMTHSGTTADPFVRRAAQLFGLQVVEFIPWPTKKNQSQRSTLSYPCYYWQGMVPQKKSGENSGENSSESAGNSGAWADQNLGDPAALMHPASGSPISGGVAPKQSDLADGIPASPDACLIAWTRHLFLLSIRSGGNVWRGVQSRLQQSETDRESRLELEGVPHASTHPPKPRFLICPRLTKRKVQRELLSMGGVGWYLWESSANDLWGHTTRTDTSSQHAETPGSDDLELMGQEKSNLLVATNRGESEILSLDEFPQESFLIHWTRRNIGPWPDQSDNAFIDSLLFQDGSRFRGELQVLNRILVTGRVLGSRRWNRVGQPVVSLADRRLSELSSLTTFRQHLARWDGLPYGIAVDREVIRQRGGRPVIYGEEADWQRLAPEKQPLFQLARSKDGKIDWQQEREWRWLGDLNLRNLPIQSVAIFVQHRFEAQQLAPYSRWPIIHLRSAGCQSAS